MGKVLLSADSESLMHPELMGLKDIQLEGEEWLVMLSNARGAREFASGGQKLDEAWVVSSDDVPGINLAAALRADNTELPIYLVMSDPSGSDASRAKQAGLTGILSADAFRSRYASARKRKAAMRNVAKLKPMKAGAEEGDSRPPHEGELLSEAKAAHEGAEAGASSKTPASTPIPIAKESSGFVITVMSGSGGVGKSATCAIAAHACAARGFKTAVIDCDLQFGDMKNIMGGIPSVSMDDALEDPAALAALAEAAPDGLPALVYAPKRLERSEELAAHMASLANALASEFEIVLANTGASWSEGHAQLLERSNCPVFLLDQRASSVRSCQHALDLCLRLGIATGSFVYALNRCERGSLFSAVDIANVMHGAQVFELREGGIEVEELLGAGLAGDLAASKNDFCESVDKMLSEVLP